MSPGIENGHLSWDPYEGMSLPVMFALVFSLYLVMRAAVFLVYLGATRRLTKEPELLLPWIVRQGVMLFRGWRAQSPR